MVLRIPGRAEVTSAHEFSSRGPEARGYQRAFLASSLGGGSGAPEERLANFLVAPPGAPRGVIRSPTRPLFLPFPVLKAVDRAMQPCNIRHRDCSRGGPF